MSVEHAMIADELIAHMELHGLRLVKVGETLRICGEHCGYSWWRGRWDCSMINDIQLRVFKLPVVDACWGELPPEALEALRTGNTLHLLLNTKPWV